MTRRVRIAVAIVASSCLAAARAPAPPDEERAAEASIRALVKDWPAGSVACLSVNHSDVADAFLLRLRDVTPEVKHSKSCSWSEGAVVSGTRRAHFVDVSEIRIHGDKASAALSNTYGNVGANGYEVQLEKGADGVWKVLAMSSTWIS